MAATCRTTPFARIKRVVSRRGGFTGDAEQRAEGVEQIESSIEPEGELDQRLVVDAVAFATRASTNPSFVDFDMLVATPADTVLVRPHHAGAQLVQDLECRLVALQSDPALELHGGHAGRLTGDEIRRPEPDTERRVRALHHRAHGEAGVLPAVAAAQDAWAVREAERRAGGSAGQSGPALGRDGATGCIEQGAKCRGAA
jgi:hypothetical protein